MSYVALVFAVFSIGFFAGNWLTIHLRAKLDREGQELREAARANS